MKKNISQLKLPDPSDTDPHPRLLLDGYGIHAGESWNETGPACWYISTPGYSDVCPVGLFVEV